MEDDDVQLLTTIDLERKTGISRTTWQYYRATGKGPNYSKIGNRVFYTVEDFRKWLEEHRRDMTQEDK